MGSIALYGAKIWGREEEKRISKLQRKVHQIDTRIKQHIKLYTGRKNKNEGMKNKDHKESGKILKKNNKGMYIRNVRK